MHVETLKTRVNLHTLRDYLEVLETNYNHLRWNAHDTDVDMGVGGHQIDRLYSWAINTNAADITKPVAPYNINKQTANYRDTELMFGPVEKIKNKFPMAHAFSISAHPAETKINLHIDSDDYWKIHIPIYTNKDAVFVYENDDYHLPATGAMYLINTSVKHGTINRGTSDRIHLLFKIPAKDVDTVRNMEGFIE